MNLYINLPVADLARSRAFFGRLGFEFNEAFSDATALAMRISDSVSAILLTHEKFGPFTPRPTRVTEQPPICNAPNHSNGVREWPHRATCFLVTV